MAKDVTTEIRIYVETAILPQYAAFDKAHQCDHVERVIEESLRLSAFYAETDINMVYVIAAYHDLGLCVGRELHQITSGKILQADRELKGWFTEEQVLVMKEAVEDHRASSKTEPRSIYGKIVAEADRIIDPQVTLLRTVQYGLTHYPQLSREEQYERFRSHLVTKYGENGYLRLWIPQSDNAERLAAFRKLISNEAMLREQFDAIYEKEK